MQWAGELGKQALRRWGLRPSERKAGCYACPRFMAHSDGEWSGRASWKKWGWSWPQDNRQGKPSAKALAMPGWGWGEGQVQGALGRGQSGRGKVTRDTGRVHQEGSAPCPGLLGEGHLLWEDVGWHGSGDLIRSKTSPRIPMKAGTAPCYTPGAQNSSRHTVGASGGTTPCLSESSGGQPGNGQAACCTRREAGAQQTGLEIPPGEPLPCRAQPRPLRAVVNSGSPGPRCSGFPRTSVIHAKSTVDPRREGLMET